MKQGLPLFEEKQYVGYNRSAFIRRTCIVLFALAVYLYNTEYKNSQLFLFLSIMVLLVSVLMLFVLHLHTIVYHDHLLLEGYWGSRKVKVLFSNIAKVEKGHYSKFFLNSPVYNLHLKKATRFYTYGNDVVRLLDKQGMVYVIGTQKADRLLTIIAHRLERPE